MMNPGQVSSSKESISGESFQLTCFQSLNGAGQLDKGQLAFNFKVDLKNETLTYFDSFFRRSWESRQHAMNYKVANTTRAVTKYPYYVLELNEDRAIKRRSPQEIESLTQPFNAKEFNFTKLATEELMMKAVTNYGTHYIAINKSPISKYHSLLLPNLYEKLPQILTKNGLRFALYVVLLSGQRSLRVGFNGLCANASVNHLHFHAYYTLKLELEKLVPERLAGLVGCVESWPAKCYALDVKNEANIEPIIDAVIKMTDFFTENSYAHNLLITHVGDCVRIFVWVREQLRGKKELTGFSPGFCELSGHILIKDSVIYKTILVENIDQMLINLTETPYNETKSLIKKLFSNETVKL